MSKKILDTSLMLMFCLALLTTSNIKDYSFTTESNEIESSNEAGIERNKIITGNEELNGNNVIDREVSQEFRLTAGASGIYAAAQDLEPEESAVQNRWNISLTEEEIQLLANIVWLEASGEGKEGQEAVVEVVFNRMVSKDFPNTLYEVLSQNKPVQFCSWKSRDTASPTELEYQSIENVLQGKTSILRNDTMYFSTSMQTSELDVKINHHYFCY